LQLGVKYGDPNIEGGLKAITEFYKKACRSNCHLSAYDGSGLSRFTAVSAAQVVDLLLYDFQDLTQRKLLLNQLPAAGKEGSLKWFGDRTNLEGNMRGKSGSMEGVRAYAGEMTAFSGRQLAFAVLVNNFDGSGIELKEKIEHMLLKLYGDY
jgi:D-alanyl-D-alanine carboxypeptidase/D-alanyl-D-alanine-endopeptidase (penicillin-binding protein 4)